jgi:hypothetical protein
VCAAQPFLIFIHRSTNGLQGPAIFDSGFALSPPLLPTSPNHQGLTSDSLMGFTGHPLRFAKLADPQPA